MKLTKKQFEQELRKTIRDNFTKQYEDMTEGGEPFTDLRPQLSQLDTQGLINLLMEESWDAQSVVDLLLNTAIKGGIKNFNLYNFDS